MVVRISAAGSKIPPKSRTPGAGERVLAPLRKCTHWILGERLGADIYNRLMTMLWNGEPDLRDVWNHYGTWFGTYCEMDVNFLTFHLILLKTSPNKNP